MRRYSAFDLLIIDELGYPPVDKQGAVLLKIWFIINVRLRQNKWEVLNRIKWPDFSGRYSLVLD
jgi:DNA replication protein DnaC